MTKTINKFQKTTTSSEERLKQLYPECLTEGEVDLEKLKDLLCSKSTEENADELYRFTWAGKSNAIRLLNTATELTLKPCCNDSIKSDTSQNLFIYGNNLEALKLLYKSYFGCVKAIDPPYNTRNDFVYRDNYRKPLDTHL